MSPHGDLESDGTNAGKRTVQTYRGLEFQHPEIKRTDRRGEKQARNEPGRNASLLATK